MEDDRNGYSQFEEDGGEPNLIDSHIDDFDQQMMEEASINCPPEMQ